MKKTAAIILLATLTLFAAGQGKEKPKALILIDIQEFYFPGGDAELVNPDTASARAAQILARFRESGDLVVHIKHNYNPGGDIHHRVAPKGAEKVITKNYANSFRETELLQTLTRRGIENLVIVGMQTHMCVEATTRAAADLGFDCVVIEDACATKNLKYGDRIIHWEDVHYSTFATLQPSYARVMTSGEWLNAEEPAAPAK